MAQCVESVALRYGMLAHFHCLTIHNGLPYKNTNEMDSDEALLGAIHNARLAVREAYEEAERRLGHSRAAVDANDAILAFLRTSPDTPEPIAATVATPVPSPQHEVSFEHGVIFG